MIDPREMRWIEEHAHSGAEAPAAGDVAAAVPHPGAARPRGLERGGVRRRLGRPAAWVGEKIRQGRRPRALGGVPRLLRVDVRADPRHRHGRQTAPATIVALSGDVHHAYLAEVGFEKGTGMRSNVYQAVCSPFRNPLDKNERRMMRTAASNVGSQDHARAGARSRASGRRSVRWRYAHDEAWFDNQVANLELEGRRAKFTLEKTEPPPADDGTLKLERVFERSLTLTKPNPAFSRT